MAISVNAPVLVFANEDIEITCHSILLHYSFVMDCHVHVRTTLIIGEFLSFPRYTGLLR